MLLKEHVHSDRFSYMFLIDTFRTSYFDGLSKIVAGIASVDVSFATLVPYELVGVV